jgi:DUF1707 SHOCT-like domain
VAAARQSTSARDAEGAGSVPGFAGDSRRCPGQNRGVTAYNPSIRASDSDREQVAAFLRDNLTQGRLTLEEFNQRLDAVYASKTYGDLDALMVDLPRRPGTGPWTLADAGAQLAERWERRRVDKNRRSWSRFFTVNAALWIVWAFFLATPGHHHVELWPLWLTVPWGAMLLSRRARSSGSCAARRATGPNPYTYS